MSAAEWGTFVVKSVLLVAAVLVYGLFAIWLGRALKAASDRLYQAQITRAHMLAIEEDRERERARVLDRQKWRLTVAEYLVNPPEPRAKEDEGFQDRARKAESLGFLDANDPWIEA